MHISHVAPRYFPAISGSEFYIQQISELIQKKNHDIKVFCSNALDFHAFGNPNGKIIDEKYIIIDNVPIFRYSIKYFPGVSLFIPDSYPVYKKILRKLNHYHLLPFGYLNILSNGPFTPNLFLQLLRDQTDIIHTVCMPFATNLFALLAGKIKQVPTICTPFYHFVNPRYHDSSYIKFLNNFDKILTCSQMESSYLVQNGLQKEKIQRIHMGIDAKKMLKGKAEKFRTQFNIDNDQKIILFCGYKNFEKGAISLLHSIEYVVKKYPNCRFIFIGPSTTAFNRTKKNLGPLRKYIINIGVVPYYSKIKLNAFAASDIYAMPSRSDAYGIAFLEAWINKKPVIGANVGATPEIIQNEKDGLLVPFHSPLKLGEAILRLLKNEQEAHQFGETGYQKIQNRTWDRVAAKIERLYQEMISH
ncbi:MAG TPA: glycosyltransferase family 4 protein [Candidatus Deferrimicrobium sp.]|nr:glycosyltransferase family 4 protein [Candidatus Deferrimicrobium sp.]